MHDNKNSGIFDDIQAHWCQCHKHIFMRVSLGRMPSELIKSVCCYHLPYICFNVRHFRWIRFVIIPEANVPTRLNLWWKEAARQLWAWMGHYFSSNQQNRLKNGQHFGAVAHFLLILTIVKISPLCIQRNFEFSDGFIQLWVAWDGIYLNMLTTVLECAQLFRLWHLEQFHGCSVDWHISNI